MVIGDGDQRHFAEAGIEGLEIAQILPAVQCGQGPCRQRAEKRKMEQIDVKMENVELIRTLPDLINHQHEVRNDVAHCRIKAERTGTTGSQFGAGDGIPTPKERHIVAKPDKFFGQVGNDPLSAAIETRRNALNEGSDLCNFHYDLCFPPTNTNACSAAKFRSALARLRVSAFPFQSLNANLCLPAEIWDCFVKQLYAVDAPLLVREIEWIGLPAGVDHRAHRNVVTGVDDLEVQHLNVVAGRLQP